jgi:hypothetical protein
MTDRPTQESGDVLSTTSEQQGTSIGCGNEPVSVLHRRSIASRGGVSSAIQRTGERICFSWPESGTNQKALRLEPEGFSYPRSVPRVACLGARVSDDNAPGQMGVSGQASADPSPEAVAGKTSARKWVKSGSERNLRLGPKNTCNMAGRSPTDERHGDWRQCLRSEGTFCNTFFT